MHELSREVVQSHLWYLDEHPAHSVDLATHRLTSAVMLSAKIRPFPVVARQVLSLLGDEDYRTADLEGVIMKDPALAATFLRIANSALYRGLVACESVLMACARLGRNAVREIVVGVATMDMFRDVKSRGATIRNHCAATGAIGRVLADEWNLRVGEQIFLTGLLHDFGKLLCMQAGIESYDGLPPDSLDAPDRLHLIERDRLGDLPAREHVGSEHRMIVTEAIALDQMQAIRRIQCVGGQAVVRLDARLHAKQLTDVVEQPGEEQLIARAQLPFVRQRARDRAGRGAVVAHRGSAALHVAEHVHRGHADHDLAHGIATQPGAGHEHALAGHEAAVHGGVGDAQEGRRQRRVLHDHALQIGGAVIFIPQQGQHLPRDDGEGADLGAEQHGARQPVGR